jgi:CotH kinase protein/Secretion system C-terminal sorting domain
MEKKSITVFVYLILILLTGEVLKAQCLPNEGMVSIDITPDNFPGETTWKLFGNHVEIANGTVNDTSICVDTSLCMRFEIYDSYGDGICCNHGLGSYSILWNGNQVGSGGAFAAVASHSFNCPVIGYDLPLIVINTPGGQAIPDEPKINATIKIIDNAVGLNYPSDPPNVYSGNIGIELRGSSSMTFPQQSYGFETWDSNSLAIDVSLMGLPAEEDWILYAPYNDKTGMRNVLTYHLANEMGNYASRTKYCELFLNGEYQGIYVLMEKIKRGDDRVDIAKLKPTDIAGDDLTGGYIIKVDKLTGSSTGDSWYSNFQMMNNDSVRFIYDYPKASEIVNVQKDYIKNYVDSFYVALYGPNFTDPINGYRKYIKTETFVDFLLLNEVAKNIDRFSTYLHKEKDSDGGLLRMGPVWDFNLAWWNCDYCDGFTFTGHWYDYEPQCSFIIPKWWRRLMDDPQFQNEVRCRYDTQRQTILSETYLFNYIDSVGNYLQNAQVNHFNKWPILGVYTWPNPSPIATTYDGEKDALKSWIQNRLNWLDANLPGVCNLTATEHSDDGGNAIMLYPNPAKESMTLRINSNDDMQQLTIYSLHGQAIKTVKLDGFEKRISIEDLPNGIYLLELLTNNATIHEHFIKE